MAMKPNYRQERQTRERAKDAKKQEKLRRREEDSAKRKALRADGSGGESSDGPGDDPGHGPAEPEKA